MYAIIHGQNEDGREVILLENDEQLREFLDDPRAYCGVTEFKTEITEPSEMDDSQAMLIKFELLIPKEKTKAWKLEP